MRFPHCQLSTFNYERHVTIAVLPPRSTQRLSPQTENLLEPFSNCAKFLANLIRKPHLKGIRVKISPQNRQLQLQSFPVGFTGFLFLFDGENLLPTF